MNGSNAPGYYHAAGDPPGTVRYWDGTNWIGGPTTLAAPSSGPPANVDTTRYGSVGIRIGAALSDAVISVVIFATVAAIAGLGSAILTVSLGWWIVTVVMTAQFGGSPGKLLVGLRVTEQDAATTPPGYGPAFVRTLPNLVQAVPVVGGLLGLGLVVLNIVFVAQDAERRSVHDRLGGTRVVYRNRL